MNAWPALGDVTTQYLLALQQGASPRGCRPRPEDRSTAARLALG